MSDATENRNALTGDNAYFDWAPRDMEMPVAASTHCYKGTLAGEVLADSARSVKPLTTDGTTEVLGVFDREVDNSAGAKGDKKAKIRSGCVALENALSGDALTYAHLYKPVFAKDNQTAQNNNASGEPCIGVLVGFQTFPNTGKPVVLVDRIMARLMALQDQLGTARSAYTQTYSTADKTIASPTATAVAAITENGGAVGGTNDGDMPSLTATAATLTVGTLGGSANGAMETVGATNSGDVSGAIMNNFQELLTQLNAVVADNVALRAGLREVAAKLVSLATFSSAIVADDLDNRKGITAIIDDLQALGLVG